MTTTTRKILAAVPLLADPRAAHYLDRLRAAGCEVIVNTLGRVYTEAEMLELIPDCFATLASAEPYNERVFGAARRLRVVARLGVGYDQIDVEAATAHGVAIAMAFGTNHESVADHAFTLMADLSRDLTTFNAQTRAGGWRRYSTISLWRSTVGIVGLGRIGRAFARRCKAFEMRVLAYDIKPDPEYAAANGIELTDFETLLRESDFISLHVPLTKQSEHMISGPQLVKMKKSAFVINTARGGVIDEDALHKALTEKTIAGAGLDVFREEPPVGSPLLKLPNVLATPHMAGLSFCSEDAMANRAIDSILAVAAGRHPGEEYVLNPQVLNLPR